MENPQPTKPEIERDLGPQPILQLLEKHNLKSHDLVAASGEHITHKMVARACKGRRLTSHVQQKILRALNKASGQEFRLADTFTY
jgi:aspartokinase